MTVLASGDQMLFLWHLTAECAQNGTGHRDPVTSCVIKPGPDAGLIKGCQDP